MLRNFFTLAIRNLFNRKLYSFINIFGLALGIAVCLVILKYVDFQFSYDDFQANASSIFRITNENYRNGQFTGADPLSGYAIGPEMQAKVPGIKAYVRTHPMYGGVVVTSYPEGKDPVTFKEDNVEYVDSTFLHVFTYQPLYGNLKTALAQPSTAVLTESMAAKYFGDASKAVGQIIKLSGGWTNGDITVTAVIKDVPQNTTFPFDMLLNIHNLLQRKQYTEDDGWGWYNFVTYVELENKATRDQVMARLPEFMENERGEQWKKDNSKAVIKLQPLREIHMDPGLNAESAATVNPNSVYFLLIIAGFILVIAWVNYVNLSTARAMERAREVGIKKAIGVHRAQLIRQFFMESALVNFCGVVLALCVAELLMPLLVRVTSIQMALDILDPRLWIILGSLFLLGSFVSGLYPAVVLSQFKTVSVLKGFRQQVGGISLRKALVVFQFSSSLILIGGTFAIYRQVTFLRGHDKGMNMDHMLVMDGPRIMDGTDDQRMTRMLSFKNEVSNLAAVDGVTTSGSVPGAGFNWGTSMRKSGLEASAAKSGNATWVDPDFIHTYGIELIAGHVWNPDSKTDMGSVLLNENAITTFGLGTPREALNEKLIVDSDTVNIIGVLKNYNWNSLKTAYVPVVLFASKVQGHNISVHISGADTPGTVREIEKLYEADFPGNPFDYFFLDDFFNQQYKGDQQFGKIFGIFAILAVVIACLGLFGLAAYTTTQRLREIGIRKVLGASVSGIVSLMSSQFIKLVVISSIIALPLMAYLVNRWLDNFAFHIGLRWELFIAPVVALLVIALGTVSLQILRGAQANPATVLRNE